MQVVAETDCGNGLVLRAAGSSKGDAGLCCVIAGVCSNVRLLDWQPYGASLSFGLVSDLVSDVPITAPVQSTVASGAFAFPGIMSFAHFTAGKSVSSKQTKQSKQLQILKSIKLTIDAGVGRNMRRRATPRVQSIKRSIDFVQFFLKNEIAILHSYPWSTPVYARLGQLLHELDDVKFYEIEDVEKLMENQRRKKRTNDTPQGKKPEDAQKGRPPSNPAGGLPVYAKATRIFLQIAALEQQFDTFKLIEKQQRAAPVQSVPTQVSPVSGVVSATLAEQEQDNPMAADECVCTPHDDMETVEVPENTPDTPGTSLADMSNMADTATQDSCMSTVLETTEYDRMPGVQRTADVFEDLFMADVSSTGFLSTFVAGTHAPVTQSAVSEDSMKVSDLEDAGYETFEQFARDAADAAVQMARARPELPPPFT